MSKKRVLVQSRFCHHNVRNCKSQSFESSQMISITIDDVPLDRRAKLEKGFGKWWADEENEKILNIFDKMFCEFCGIEVRTFYIQLECWGFRGDPNTDNYFWNEVELQKQPRHIAGKQDDDIIAEYCIQPKKCVPTLVVFIDFKRSFGLIDRWLSETFLFNYHISDAIVSTKSNILKKVLPSIVLNIDVGTFLSVSHQC